MRSNKDSMRKSDWSSTFEAIGAALSGWEGWRGKTRQGGKATGIEGAQRAVSCDAADLYFAVAGGEMSEELCLCHP